MNQYLRATEVERDRARDTAVRLEQELAGIRVQLHDLRIRVVADTMTDSEVVDALYAIEVTL
jgi:hypothetical protein